jgi:TRAP-type C4-dicarboxylate transport system substrate-binding protein
MRCFLIGLLLAALALPLRAEDLKLGTLVPEGSAWHDILRDLAEDWKRATGGAVTLRIYPGGIAGDEPDMVRKMRVNQLQAAALSGTGLQQIAQEVAALQLPMMFRSDEEFLWVSERVRPRLEKILEEKNFIVLGWGDVGWVYFFTQRPVVTPEELRPLKIFSWSGDDALVEAWKRAGYHPVPLAATEIHAGLQSGVINAFAVPPVAALSYQWFGLAPHMTGLKWAPLVGALVVSTTSWRRVPEGSRASLLALSRQAGSKLQAESRRVAEKAVEVMRQHGLAVHDVPTAIAATWEENARPSWPSLVGPGRPAEMMALTSRLRDEYRQAGSPK